MSRLGLATALLNHILNLRFNRISIHSLFEQGMYASFNCHDS